MLRQLLPVPVDVLRAVLRRGKDRREGRRELRDARTAHVRSRRKRHLWHYHSRKGSRFEEHRRKFRHGPVDVLVLRLLRVGSRSERGQRTRHVDDSRMNESSQYCRRLN